MQDGTAYGDIGECIRAARASMRQVNQLLVRSSAESAEHTSSILREVEVQLGCAAAILRSNGPTLDSKLRSEIEDLQDQVAVLSRFLGETDKLLSGWLRAVRTRRGGYTEQGRAAPLVLVNKLRAEG
ncbi:MAG TPA: hypothetical protein VEU96_00665 [Bryobacteraceae bacterium]|nr:hypothetical protein [Bryobacteraceae bacterium]